MRVAALGGSDVPMAHHFMLRFDGPDCLLDLAHSLLGIPVRETLKNPVFRETAALYPAWLLGSIFREMTFSDHP